MLLTLENTGAYRVTCLHWHIASVWKGSTSAIDFRLGPFWTWLFPDRNAYIRLAIHDGSITVCLSYPHSLIIWAQVRFHRHLSISNDMSMYGSGCISTYSDVPCIYFTFTLTLFFVNVYSSLSHLITFIVLQKWSNLLDTHIIYPYPLTQVQYPLGIRV